MTIARTINDLCVGMTVKHFGDENAGETGVITSLTPGDFGGTVRIQKEDVTHTTGRYFDGFCGSRKWEILAPAKPAKPAVKVGDTVKVVDVAEGVVTKVSETGLWLDGTYYSKVAVPDWTRTVEVTKVAALPWQAGDIVRGRSGATYVRQANADWLNSSGHATGWDDAKADTFTAVVRGGVRA